jgi:hypothetical protein
MGVEVSVVFGPIPRDVDDILAEALRDLSYPSKGDWARSHPRRRMYWRSRAAKLRRGLSRYGVVIQKLEAVSDATL